MKTATRRIGKPQASTHEDDGEVALRAVVVRDTGPYSARNSSKGALIDEARRVYAALALGQSVETVREEVFRGTLLTQRSRENRERIWTSIQQRYLIPTTPWLTSQLENLCASGAAQRRVRFTALFTLRSARPPDLRFRDQCAVCQRAPVAARCFSKRCS